MEAEINDDAFEKKYARFEKTFNPLTPYQENFFKKLSVSLDTKLYYYGSIQRIDYFTGYSDIDVCMFSGNVESTLKKVQLLLGLDQNDYDHLYVILDKNVMYECYKIIYEEPENNLSAEIAIYNNSFKHDNFYHFGRDEEYPFYIVYLLFILKFLYYKIGILPIETYKSLKKMIMNNTIRHKRHVKHRKNIRE
jgi:hypothetical protein